MNERVMQFRVGVMVIATLLITGILILLFDGFPKVGTRPYVIKIIFVQAPGVTDGTPIRKSGIRIGRVRSVQFTEDVGMYDVHGVVVFCEIDANRTLRSNEQPVIDRSLLGESYIEFITRESGGRPIESLEPGTQLVGTVKSDPLQVIGNIEGTMASALGSVAKTSDEIGALARRVNDLIRNNDEQLSRIVTKTEGVVESLQQTIQQASGLIGDPQIQGNLRRSIEQMPRVLADLDEAVQSLKPAMKRADSILGDLQNVSRPLGERGPMLVQNIDSAVSKLDRALENITALSEDLRKPDGTIGRLLNDPGLYDKLNGVASNVQELTRELRPIVRDARAFTDKVSRHPESLGIRGAIFPNSGIK